MLKYPDWTDVQFFLAVARTGKLSLAGQRMGVEHSTVSRRIDRLEETVGAVLFDRHRTGYSLTDAGKALVRHAEVMETALLEAIEESTSSSVFGSVRVGTPEAFGVCVLAPHLAELRKRHPNLHIELIAQPHYPSLVAREVDILVTLDPPQAGRYTVSRLTDIDYFFYGAPGYLQKFPPIETAADLVQHTFVDYVHDGSMSDRFLVLEEVTPEPVRVLTSTSILAQREAAASGMGLILLTPYVVGNRQDLVNVLPDKPQITRKMWLAAPNDLFRTKRVRLVWDFIVEVISSRPEYFRR